MLYLLYTIHVLICLFLILVVLLQQGSGADLSVFGGGATQTAFGARSATSLLHRLTVGAFIGFIVTTITIGFVRTGPGGGSVMTDLPATEETAAETVPTAAEEVPAEPSGEVTELEVEEPGEALEPAESGEPAEPPAASGGEEASTGEPGS